MEELSGLLESGQLIPIEGRREVGMLLNECQETSNYDMSGECDSGMKMNRCGLIAIHAMEMY